MPAVAAAASLMEATGLPLRELRRRYTKSEVAIMSWRSQEIAENMAESHKPVAPQENPMTRMAQAAVDKRAEEIEERLGDSIIKRVIDEHGEVDMRNLTGDEACAYLGAMGCPIGAGVQRVG